VESLSESPALALNVPEAVVEVALPAINPPTVGEGGSVGLSGSGEPGATVELWAGDEKLGDVLVGGDGTWSWEGVLDPGDYELRARTVAASGETLNENPAPALNVPEAAPAPTQPGQGQGYIVQRGDYLSALAKRFYGDGRLWELIYRVTNERAVEDPTFHIIEDPNLIMPGWQLWIPAQ
jgi:hypothetical protein